MRNEGRVSWVKGVIFAGLEGDHTYPQMGVPFLEVLLKVFGILFDSLEKPGIVLNAVYFPQTMIEDTTRKDCTDHLAGQVETVLDDLEACFGLSHPDLFQPFKVVQSLGHHHGVEGSS